MTVFFYSFYICFKFALYIYVRNKYTIVHLAFVNLISHQPILMILFLLESILQGCVKIWLGSDHGIHIKVLELFNSAYCFKSSFFLLKKLYYFQYYLTTSIVLLYKTLHC